MKKYKYVTFFTISYIYDDNTFTNTETLLGYIIADEKISNSYAKYIAYNNIMSNNYNFLFKNVSYQYLYTYKIDGSLSNQYTAYKLAVIMKKFEKNLLKKNTTANRFYMDLSYLEANLRYITLPYCYIRRSYN